MPAFERNEIVSATQLVRSFSTYLGNLKSRNITKLGIIRNNEMEAVVLPITEYERLYNAAQNSERKNIKDFFGAIDNDTFTQMEKAVAECRQVDLNEW